jgi:serine/threonine protein kinase
VALKVMLPAIASDPQARARFLREARAAARVECDYIVPIYQVGDAGGMPFFAMPLLVGEPLDARLQRVGPLLPVEVLLLGRQMAEGLAAAHAVGLIHRDIKPSNVWLERAPDGTVRRARILDFGLARAPGDAILTGAGDVSGTPAYMSVEQARGQPVDFRTDLFSLGVVLYEAATGKRAFSGQTAYAILAALATQTPPAPNAVNPDVPVGLSELIVHLMSKTPAGRPQSAQRVADELARLAALLLPLLPGSRHVLPALPATVGSKPTLPSLPAEPAPAPALVETNSVVSLPTLPVTPQPAPEPPAPDPEPLPVITKPAKGPQGSRAGCGVLVAVGLLVPASLLAPGAVHHVRPQYVLPPTHDRCPLVQEVVEEHESFARFGRHADLGPVRQRQTVIDDVEHRLTAFAAAAEVHHERELAALVVAREVAVGVRAEPVAGVVPVEPEPLVEPGGLVPQVRRRDQRPGPLP